MVPSSNVHSQHLCEALRQVQQDIGAAAAQVIEPPAQAEGDLAAPTIMKLVYSERDAAAPVIEPPAQAEGDPAAPAIKKLVHAERDAVAPVIESSAPAVE